jgi:hypothetical protein
LAFSGVPKAGAPERMSTFEVNAPYMTGRSAAHQLGEHDAEERLGILLREGRRERCGGHRSHESERRDHHGLAVLRHRDQSLAHRLIEAARTVHRDDGDDARALGACARKRDPRAIAIMRTPSSARPAPIAVQ